MKSIAKIVCIAAVLLWSAAAGAQTPAAPLASWDRALADLAARVTSVREGDSDARARLERDVDALRAVIVTWLEAHGRPLPATPAGGAVADLATGIEQLRAAVTQARAAEGDATTGAFYLGRVDVSVTGSSAAPGVTAITADTMRALEAKTVTEALAAASGVTMHRMGPRNEGMVYIRGFDLRQIPLFVDGVPVYVPYDGYVDLDRFVTDDLAEVRVTKGMTSVLIGPNALGGAINLVTKRPSRPVEGLFNLTVGSGDERAADVNLGVRRPLWYAQGTGSWLQSGDFPLSGDFVPVPLQRNDRRDNSDRKDGKASLKFALTPAGGEYAVSYVSQRGEKGVPPYAGTNPLVRARFWRWPDWDKDSLYLVTNTPLGGSRYLRGRLFYDRFYNELQSFDDAGYQAMTRPSSFRSIYDDYTNGGSVEFGTALAARQTVRMAAHIKEDIHREHNIGEPIRTFDNRTLSFGIEDSLALSSRVTVVAGIGLDRQLTRRAENLVAGGVADFPKGDTSGINPQAGLFVALPNSSRLRFEAYRKTRLPAIKDRYSYRMGSAIPNPDLKAEQATTFEAGIDGVLPQRWGGFALTGFVTGVDDLVQAFFLQPNLFQLQNVGDVRNSGVEAEWNLPTVFGLRSSAGYSYLHRENRGATAVPLLNTPRHKIFGSVVYGGLPRTQLVAAVNAESTRAAQDDGGTLLTLDGYSTTMLKASVRVVRNTDVEVSVLNAFDRNYQLYPGFPETGRVVQGSLRLRF